MIELDRPYPDLRRGRTLLVTGMLLDAAGPAHRRGVGGRRRRHASKPPPGARRSASPRR